MMNHYHLLDVLFYSFIQLLFSGSALGDRTVFSIRLSIHVFYVIYL